MVNKVTSLSPSIARALLLRLGLFSCRELVTLLLSQRRAAGSLFFFFTCLPAGASRWCARAAAAPGRRTWPRGRPTYKTPAASCRHHHFARGAAARRRVSVQFPSRAHPVRAMGRRGSGGEDHRPQQEDQQQQRAAVPRRGRWLDEERPHPHQPAAAGWRCRSCAAAAIADCVALGCCPCAVVALLALALVRAPLAVGRRLRMRRRSALRRKRVRDVAAKVAPRAAPGAGSGTTPLDPAAAATPVRQQQQQTQTQAEVEELAWLDEMYRVGHWGFGRVSFSGSAGKTP
jgi:hypothetical protein